MKVVLAFISRWQSCPPPPPNPGPQQCGDERKEDENDPAEVASRTIVETEDERLRYFWCDANELLTAEEPVHASGHEIERLLALGQCLVLYESGVAHDHHARRINLHAFVPASAFLDRNGNGQRFAVIARWVELQLALVGGIIIRFTP